MLLRIGQPDKERIMLRDETLRKLDRKFTKIETWEEFLQRWNAINTEQEAIGLLHAGPALVVKGISAPESDRINEGVKFYLLVGAHENKAVSLAAQQIVIKCWLKKARTTAEYVDVHRALLEFLVLAGQQQAEIVKQPFNPQSPLLEPPYPRFVSEYLLKVYEVWHHAHRQERDYEAFQVLTDSLALAACVWGVSYVFARDGNGWKTMPVIEAFLKHRGYDLGKALMSLSGYGEPLAKLSSPSAQEDANKRAALALLKMRYWSGEGVHESFDRSRLAGK